MKLTSFFQGFVWAVGFFNTLKEKQAIKWAKGKKYEFVKVETIYKIY